MSATMTTRLNGRMDVLDSMDIASVDFSGNGTPVGAPVTTLTGMPVDVPTQTPIRVLLVDDQIHVRRGLRMRLALEDDVIVVGDAGDAETALVLAEQLRPDVIIMDVELPGIDGITATERFQHIFPGLAVVMLTLHDDPDTQTRARAAGAQAFVAKHRMEGPLLAAIRQSARET